MCLITEAGLPFRCLLNLKKVPFDMSLVYTSPGRSLHIRRQAPQFKTVIALWVSYLYVVSQDNP